MAEHHLPAADFAFVARLVQERCGLVLEPGKEYLVQSRLAPVAHRHGDANLARLIDRLRRGGDPALLAEVVEAMVTTETSFFRDIHPFETLRTTVLPELIRRRAGQRGLNIWCAACSSGQEPYSLAILLKESFPELANWRVRLWATDISQKMLDRCQAGRYWQVEVNRGLSPALLSRWFRQEGTTWILDESVKSSVTFSRLNLVEPWPAMPEWDLILLRNVMIYFEDAAKRAILGRATRVLRSDGYLVLGGAETTLSLDGSYARIEALKSGFYQRKQAKADAVAK